MKVYNSYSFQLEQFEPLKEGKVGMYVCGPTVYDVPHLGHARSEVVFDMIRKYLEHKDFEVTYVHNYTDVDDKMIKRANKRGITVKKLAQENIEAYEEMQEYLNIKNPTHKPRATEEIDAMIELVKTLEKKGFTYEANGSVYFNTAKFDKYENLFQRNEKSEGEEEDEFSTSEYIGDKKNLEDFVLWKKKKQGEPSWQSPWGEGRPGWHIECTVMSSKYIGDTIDIHGGGIDLKQPHHKNEIAQGEAATGKKFCNYWLHNGFLQINNEKMSKSLGNFITATDLQGKYPGNLIRYFLLSNQYRSPINFSEDLLDQAKKALSKILEFYSDLEKYEKVSTDDESSSSLETALNQVKEHIKNFFKAMDTDFNTAEALGYLFKLINFLQPKINKEHTLSETLKCEVLDFLESIDSFMGFFPVERVKDSKWKSALQELVDELVNYRNDLRIQNSYDIADALRDILQNNGIEIHDDKKSSSWEFKTIF